jgi:hypothetical protein
MSRVIIGAMIGLALITTTGLDRSERLATAAGPPDVTDNGQLLWSFDAGG